MKNSFLYFIFLILSPSIFAGPLPVILDGDWQITKVRWNETLSDSLENRQFILLSKSPLSDISTALDLNKSTFRAVVLQKYFFIDEASWNAGDKDSFTLFLPGISNVFELYLNGQKFFQRGEIIENRITKNGYGTNISVILNRSILNQGRNVLHIRIASPPGEKIEFERIRNNIPINIDLTSNLKFNLEVKLEFFFIFFYTIFGLNQLVFYFKNKKDKYHLLFSILILSLAISSYVSSSIFDSYDLDPFLQSKLHFLFLYLIPIWLILFLEKIFENKIKFLGTIFIVIYFTLSLSNWLLPRSFVFHLFLLWQYSLILPLLYSLVLLWKALVNLSPDAKKIAIGYMIAIFCAAMDLIETDFMNGFQTLQITKYGISFFVFGLGLILTNRSLQNKNESENIRNSLEKNLTATSNELKVAQDLIVALKQRQLIDFYSASQLLKKLINTKVSSKNLIVDCYLKQQKEFLLNNSKFEIGGDLIILDRISLGDKSYFVFANADALSKSIQGAEGAIIFGVLFHFFLKRTHNSNSSLSNLHPETWLFEWYKQLKELFEQFEDKYRLSMILGLLDEERGIVYFLNLNHPQVILFREEVALFLEEKPQMEKVEFNTFSAFPRISIFKLKANDSLFIGSDGKDSLVVKDPAVERKWFNEDETQILRRIEESKGDMKSLLHMLQRFGSFFDDFSILKLQWIAENDDKKKSTVPLKKELATSIRAKNWNRAISIGEILAEMEPLDEKIQFYLSYSYRKIRNLNLSFRWAEKIFLRNPNFLRNLIHLAEICKISNQQDYIKRLRNHSVEAKVENQRLERIINS